jgi:hypothetical protein
MKTSKRENAFALSWSKKLKAIKFLKGKCEKCGCDDPVVLDFHHLRDKETSIRWIREFRWSTILEEVKKCQLLCSNCHKEHHCKNSRNSKIKKSLHIDRSLTECSKCKYRGENFASLEFHHKDPNQKEFEITKALYRITKVSVQELNDELDKCIVLCSNCHRKEHFDYEKFNRLKPLIYKKMSSHKEQRPKINRNMVLQKMLNGSRQTDIVKELGCSKGTISGIVKSLKEEGKL